MKLLETVQKYTLYIVLLLFPVFMLPQFASPFVVPKEIFLVTGLSILIILWVIQMVVKGSLSFAVGKFDLGVLLIAFAYLISTILATPNKMEAYLFPGTTTFVLAGALLYFLINQFDKKTKDTAGIALFGGALLLALGVLLAALNVFSKIPQLPAFIKDSAFNPIGGSVPAGIYLGVLLVFAIGLIIREKDTIKKLFFGVSAALMLLSTIILIGNSLPGKAQSPKLVGMQTSWEVAVEALKKSPLFGTGPANYLSAFNLFRPVGYNQTDLWQIRFTTASNYYLTLLTETGFIGLFALAILLIATYKVFVGNPKGDIEKYSLLFLLILLTVFPAAPVLMVVFFALFAIFSHSEAKSAHLNVASSDASSFASSRVPAIIVGLPFLIGIALLFIFGSKIVIAEATFKGSLDSLAKNDAKGTYDLMTKAINQNGRVDRYHASLAQIDMALAQSIASKKNITDTDRSTITRLVQQAINEGKLTVILNPGRSGNWEILAQIYRSIMPFATGADQFAIQTYTQAVALDPTNPNLRIALGGVYFALGRYNNAIDVFKLATLAKPDLANAHYNLAIAYRENKDFDNAIAEMNNVLALVKTDTSDYTLAKQTLENLQKNKVTAASESASLQAPKPVETSNIKPPIELPKEATPPATGQ